MSIPRALLLCSLVFASVLALALTPAERAARAVVRLALDDDRIAGTDFSSAASVTILPDLRPESAPRAPGRAVARGEENSLSGIPFPDPSPDNRAAFAALRLKASLSQVMWNNFDLFLYVSKAQHGPLAQRMIVFRKEGAEDFALIHDWAASTGRERQEVSPRGRNAFTATPPGYYQLDPQRMYRSYHSYNWDQPMPHAMFFNWERKGLQTGLAIHATAAQSLERLGQRASAGCVHLAPENAETLFNLIRDAYRGQVPRFAYNAQSRTMRNDGAFMRDGRGRLQMADGYKVLIFIEDYGGKNVVAALADAASNPL